MLNAIIGYQLLDDGTVKSIGLVTGSAVVFFIGTGELRDTSFEKILLGPNIYFPAYIALDTGFNYTGTFEVTDQGALKNYALYILYLLFPLIMIVAYFVLESVLVIKVLGEMLPMSMLSQLPPAPLQC